jgi:predicted negative regulator of RcsB-dependent stress response
MKKIGISIVYFSIFFSLATTAYFGWNWTSQSQAEKITDAISIGLFGLGSLIYISNLKSK